MSNPRFIQAAYPAAIAFGSILAVVSFAFAAPTYGPVIFLPLAVTIAALGAGAIAWWKEFGKES